MIIAITQRYNTSKNGSEIYSIHKDLTDIFKDLNVLLFPVSSMNNINEIIKISDGLIVTGSSIDINPKIYNEEPLFKVHKMALDEDALDLCLIKEFNKNNKAILGICRGIQSINVCFGGTLYQDIENHKLSKEQTHDIIVQKDSFIYDIYKKERFQVNSVHHQAIKDLAGNFKIAAKSDDGIIEAIENKNIIGVQWHPEYIKDLNFFKYFVQKTTKLTLSKV